MKKKVLYSESESLWMTVNRWQVDPRGLDLISGMAYNNPELQPNQYSPQNRSFTFDKLENLMQAQYEALRVAGELNNLTFDELMFELSVYALKTNPSFKADGWVIVEIEL